MPQLGAQGAARGLFLAQSMSTIPLTTTGAELLRQELQRLKTVDRPSAITAIAEARTHGDLSENAEYEADIKKGEVSVGSPIARALIGKYAGDEVEVQTPGGVRKYEILEVRYE